MGPQNSFKRMFKVNDVVYWARFSTNGLSLQLSIKIIQKFLYGGAKFELSASRCLYEEFSANFDQTQTVIRINDQ